MAELIVPPYNVMNMTSEEVASEFKNIQEQLNFVYEKRKALLNKALAEFDNQLFKQNEDGTWIRVTISDNAERINDGYFEFVKVERYSVKVEILKNKPKELVG